MKLNFKNVLGLPFVLILFVVGLAACQKKVAEEKSTHTSENIFTGNKTVTTDTDTQYKNRKTGELTNKTKTKKVTYDKSGKIISESEEMDKTKED